MLLSIRVPFFDQYRVLTAHDLKTLFWEDRAAHIASCQLPLIVALAGKNNIISGEVSSIGRD